MRKFIIESVKDVDTGEKSIRFGYREGRECFICSEYIEVGNRLPVYYENETMFVTATIKQVEKKDKITVTTKNRIYVFRPTVDNEDE